jgi:MFS family permease
MTEVAERPEAGAPTTSPPSQESHEVHTLQRSSFWSSTFKSLSERDYAWFFAGNGAYLMAIQMQFLLYGYLAFDLTGSAKALALVSIGNAVPALLFAPFSGAIADRVHKRIILATTQILAMTFAAVLALLVLSDAVELWHVVGISLAIGTVMALNMPTRQALVPQLVPRHKLMNAISLQMGEMNLTRIIAPALGGMLVAPLGLGWVFLISSGLFLTGTIIETKLPRHGMTGHLNKRAFLDEVKEGFHYIWNNRLLRLLLMANVFIPMFAFPAQQTLPVFAREVFDRGPGGLGILAAMGGIGGLLGAIFAANMDSQPSKGRLMLAGGLIMGLSYCAFALTPTFVLALPLLALAASGQMLFMTTNSTVIQSTITPEMRGRVMAIMSMSIGLTPLGIVPVTVAVDEVGAPATIAASSAIMLLVLATMFVLSPALRNLRLEALRRAELSPVQAAALVAEGKISQAEADRLSGRSETAASPS